jgi:hypothetical protein
MKYTNIKLLLGTLFLSVFLMSCAGDSDDDTSLPKPVGGGDDGGSVAVTIQPTLVGKTVQYVINKDVSDTITNSAGAAGAVSTCTANDVLPTGLDVVASGGTCVITGTAPSTAAGAQDYRITGTNEHGSSQATINIEITASLTAPNLQNHAAQTFTVGTDIGSTITFTNNGGGSITSCTGAVPAGLTLDKTADGSSCKITGAPTTAKTATTYTITASNATGADATPATISITVNAAAAPGCDDCDNWYSAGCPM